MVALLHRDRHGGFIRQRAAVVADLVTEAVSAEENRIRRIGDRPGGGIGRHGAVRRQAREHDACRIECPVDVMIILQNVDDDRRLLARRRSIVRGDRQLVRALDRDSHGRRIAGRAGVRGAIGNPPPNDGRIEILRALPGGGFAVGEPIVGPVSLGPLSIADWNGDGNPDVADLNPAIPNRTPLFYPGRGDGTLQVARTQFSGDDEFSPGQLLTADVNGDGFPDLVTGSDGGIIVSLGNGTGHYDQPTVVGEVPTDSETARGFDFAAFGSATTVATADLNGDGRMDLVAGSGVSLQMSDGQFAAPRKYGPDATESVIGDLDGDGFPDIVEITTSGMIQTLLNDGKGGFTVGPSFNPGTGASSLLLRDLNGDGKLDVAFTLQGDYDPYTGKYVNAGVGVALGNGDGSFGPVRRYDAGAGYAGFQGQIFASTARLAAGDLNSDGILSRRRAGLLLHQSIRTVRAAGQTRRDGQARRDLHVGCQLSYPSRHRWVSKVGRARRFQR
jgi:hypothetical protein